MRKLFAVTLSLLIMLTAAVNTAADGVVGDKTQNTVAESENDAAAVTVNADSYTDIGDSDVVKNADGSITVSNSGGYITYSFYAEKDGVMRIKTVNLHIRGSPRRTLTGATTKKQWNTRAADLIK